MAVSILVDAFGGMASTQVRSFGRANTPTVDTINGNLTVAGNLTVQGTVGATGIITPISGTAVTAGGVVAITLGSSAPSITVGSGVPTLTAAQGSLYLRSDGGSSTRAYFNTDGAATWEAISGGTAATQAQQETATSNAVFATPLVQQFHPSAVKFWARIVGADATITSSYNVTGVVRNSAGNYTITIATDFSDNIACFGASVSAGGGNEGLLPVINSPAAGTVVLDVFKRADGTNFDPVTAYIWGFGDQ